MTASAPNADFQLTPQRQRIAYFALGVAIFMAVLDGSIANVALPQIARDLHASPATSIWIVNGFQIAVTMAIFPAAALGQLKGPARVYRVGIVVFILGSLACALSRSLVVLVCARFAQGIGAAAIMAISPALLRELFPPNQLGRALGINSLVVSTGTAAGPSIGGVILAFATWPWLFAINVPFGLSNVALNHTFPPDRPRPGKLDAASVASSAIGFPLAIWGFDGFAHGEPTWTIALRLGLGIALLAWFSRRQFVLPQPMISLDLFTIKPFAFAALTSFATFIAQGLAFVSLPFLFQEALGKSALESGLLLTSWPVAIAIVAPVAGYLSDRYPVGILATAGCAVMAVGLGLYAAMPASASTLEIVLHGALCGLGFGFFQSPNNRELIGAAPREKSSSAAGLLAAIRVGGQTIGASTVAVVFGRLGASETVGGAARAAVSAAVPHTLWLACGLAAIAAMFSGLRLRSNASQ